VAIVQIERSLQFSFGFSDGWKECKSVRWTSNAIHRVLIRQTHNLAARETRPLRSGPWTMELTAVPQFQVRFHDLLHSDPGRSRSQRRPWAASPSDPSIRPQDRNPATVPRGQPSGLTASSELGMVSTDPPKASPELCKVSPDLRISRWVWCPWICGFRPPPPVSVGSECPRRETGVLDAGQSLSTRPTRDARSMSTTEGRVRSRKGGMEEEGVAWLLFTRPY
jgi:hypothetical protein